MRSWLGTRPSCCDLWRISSQRSPALQRKAAWALACLARGKNKMRILSGDRSVRSLVVDVYAFLAACVRVARLAARACQSVDALSMQVRVQVTTMNG